MKTAYLAGALALELFGCCSCGASGSDTQKRPTVPVSSANAQSASTPECDDYFRLVKQCIESTVPEIERPAMRQKLEYERSTLSNPALDRSRAAAACTRDLRTEMRDDSHGCYTLEAFKRGVLTSCTLLTREELGKLLGAAMDPGEQDGNTCRYKFTGNDFAEPFTLKVHWEGGEDQVDAARGAEAMVDKKMKNALGRDKSVVSGSAVDNLGDDAFLTVAGIEPLLVARVGNTAIEANGASGDQLISVARVALKRMNTKDAPAATPAADAAHSTK